MNRTESHVNLRDELAGIIIGAFSWGLFLGLLIG
mgnify:CR=1 FL=1